MNILITVLNQRLQRVMAVIILELHVNITVICHIRDAIIKRIKIIDSFKELRYEG